MATNGGYELEEARGKEKGRVRNTRCSIDKVKLMAAEVAQIPSYLKEEKVFRYDSERHDLRSVVARILQVTPESLHRIHELVEFRGPQRAGKPILFHKRWANRKKHPLGLGDEFRAVLGRFVEYEVTKILNTTSTVIYQKQPVLRSACPSSEPLGHAHRDEQYYRPPFEINIWVPLTKVFGTNSLWTESERGKGDMHPFECEYGEAVRFYGHQCMHMTKTNVTDSTRVSLDFRVVVKELFVENYISPLTKKEQIASPFMLGMTYTDTETEREWRRQNGWAI